MYSKLLSEHGLVNYISGIDYKIRAKLIGIKVKDEVKRILTDMGEKPEEIYSCYQVHGNNIEYCDGRTGKEFFYGRNFLETDGLITDKENIALLIKFADCTPVVLYDPVNKVQISVHSGWRGTVKRISEVAIERMVDEFNSKREDIIAYLGPSIDIENYEVGPEVYEAFKDFKNRDEFFRPYGEKYKMSMIDANLDILLENGLKEENIEASRISTFNTKELNSARRDKEKYNLNSIVTIIK